MLSVQISTASGVKQFLTVDTALKICELRNQIEELTNLSQENFYIVQNGKLVDGNDTCYPGYVSVVPRLFGGKGGFGSMLRAIGAQIEKTTNREACRDLSGRRLRDINEEKRLKVWIEKQGKREEEAAERKKKKLQRLCAEPKHEFKDPNYDLERSVLTERVGDAVEEGLKIACTSGMKRKHNEEFKPNKKKTVLDFDIDSDELGSSDDSEEDEMKSKTVDQEEQVSNDSGHSSDESRTAHKDTNRIESECSETISDNQSSDQILSNADEKKKDCVAEDNEVSESNSPKPTDEYLKVPT